MSRHAWLTPNDAPGTAVCRTVFIPAGLEYEAAFRGAFLLLCDPENWEEHGTQTPEACADAFQAGFFETLDNWGECDVALWAVGDIRISASPSLHAGWLACDGAEYNVDDYPDLYSRIGDRYGGNPPDTFAVPDMRGRVPVGMGQGSGLTDRSAGDNGGEETHQLVTGEIPAHDHVIDHNHAGSRQFFTSNAVNGTQLTVLRLTAGTDVVTAAHSGSSGSTGGDDPHENMQPWLCLAYYIYAGV